MALRTWALAVGVLLLAACNFPAMNREVDAMARGFYDSVRTGADLSNDARLSPELRTPEAIQQIMAARQIIPNVAATRVDNRNQNYNTSTSTGSSAVSACSWAPSLPSTSVMSPSVSGGNGGPSGAGAC